MPFPLDAAEKRLFDENPIPWLLLAGVAADGARVTVLNPDKSTVSLAADRVVRVETPNGPIIVHVEFQAHHDPRAHVRMLVYQALIRMDYPGIPVRSVVFLFHRRAEHGMPGRIVDRFGDDAYLEFGYDRVRLWELPVGPLLAGPISTLPLATLAAVPDVEMPDVVTHIRRRLRDEVPVGRAKELVEATRLLMGLRFSKPLVELLMGSFAEVLEQSSVYKYIAGQGHAEGRLEGLAEGREEGREAGREEGREAGREEGREEGRMSGLVAGVLEGRRATVSRLGTARFGEQPPADVADRVRTATLDELDRMTDRLLTVAGWAELVGG